MDGKPRLDLGIFIRASSVSIRGFSHFTHYSPNSHSTPAIAAALPFVADDTISLLLPTLL